MKFEDLIGEEIDFYGVDNNEFKLSSTVFEAVEDPDDGYRSYLSSVEIIGSKGIFFQQPLAKVKVVAEEDGYLLLDVEDNHCWLDFGTDYSEDWYPRFVFHYRPKLK